MTPEECATILDLFPPKGEDPDEWVMAYQILRADGWAATNSAIADNLPLAKFVLSAIREAVEAERNSLAVMIETAGNNGSNEDIQKIYGIVAKMIRHHQHS